MTQSRWTEKATRTVPSGEAAAWPGAARLLCSCLFLSLWLLTSCEQGPSAAMRMEPPTGPGTATGLTLKEVRPASWNTAGGAELTLLGSGLTETATVTIGGKPAPVLRSDPMRSDQLVVRLPPRLGQLGPAQVTVKRATGESVSADDLFTYSASQFLFPNAAGFSGFNADIGIVAADLNKDGKTDVITVDLQGVVTAALGDGRGGFTLAGSTPHGVVTQAMIGADFNGDGRTDLALSHNTAGFSILLGTGGTSFAPITIFPITGNVIGLAAVDVNRDGKLDLVAADSLNRSVRILIGDGAGTFSAGAVRSLGSTPVQLVAADVNGDGIKDIVTANRSSSSVSVLLGDGLGGLSAATSSTLPDPPQALSTGDLNGDGKLDLIVATSSSSRQSAGVLLGDGRGAFAPIQISAIGMTANVLLTADVNVDSNLDVIVGGAEIQVLYGDGTGALAGLRAFPAGFFRSALLVADLDQDGRQDLLAGSGAFLRNSGTDGFEVATTYAVASSQRAIVAGDFNEDGQTDLIGASSSSDKRLSLFLSSGSGPLPVQFLDAATTCTALVAADLNADRHLDLVMTTSFGSASSVDSIVVLLGNGLGGFTRVPAPNPGTRPSALAVVDVNADGKLDLAVANSFSNDVYILRGDGTGQFGMPLAIGVGASPSALVTADLNGDSITDLAVLHQGSYELLALIGDGTGLFTPQGRFVTTATPNLAVTGDLDGDHRPDVLAGSGTELAILLGDGVGGFKGAGSVDLGASMTGAALGDLNGDRILDLVVTTSSPDASVRILLGVGNGRFASARRYIGLATPIAPLVADVNQDGKQDVIIGSLNTGGLVVLDNRSL